MAKKYRAVWRANTDEPAPGDTGVVCKADGYHDPESAEHEAWVFLPDKDPGGDAYYCGESDFDFIS